MRRSHRSILFLILTVTTLSVSAVTRYPVKTLVDGDTVFQAGMGVVNFDLPRQKQRWHSMPQIQTHQVVADEYRLYTAGSAGVHVLDKQSGTLQWHLTVGEELFSPVLSDGVLYLSGKNGFMAAVESVKGRLLWETRLGEGWLYPPAVVGNLLVTGGQDRIIRALDRSSGDVVWSRTLEQELVYRPVSFGSVLILTTYGGEVLAIDFHDGRLLWSRFFTTPVTSPVAVPVGVVVGSLGGELRLLDLGSGAVVWKVELPGPIIDPVQFDGGMLLAVNHEGEAFWLSGIDGRVLASHKPGTDLVGAALITPDSAVFFQWDRKNHSLRSVLVNVDSNDAAERAKETGE